MYKFLVFLFFINFNILHADVKVKPFEAEVVEMDLSVSNDEINVIKSKQEKHKQALLKKENDSKIQTYLKDLKKLEGEILQEKVWMKSYSSYLASLEVRNSLEKIKQKIAFLKHKPRTTNVEDELSSLISKEKILATQVNRLNKKDSALFSKLLTPPVVEDIIKVTSPFDIFTGISMIKTFDVYLQDYLQRKEQLSSLISLIRKENDVYNKILELDDTNNYIREAKAKAKQLERFEVALDTINVTSELYQKRLDLLEANIQNGIKEQTYRLIKIGVVIFVVILIFFLLKQVVKRYIKDNDRFYMANKVITFANVTLILMILFFNYIENVSYLVTILGFASAGIAIAMKDWFMSILGWLVIIFGGSIHVGDRIRVDMEGMKYVGDVIDISLLRMTLLEDITLSSYMHNRRAGRVIFIPNNYVFTKMIANYSHLTLKTVWDGIDISITFDSNHKKAIHICKEITKKYSKGYTDITRKQLNKIRKHYSLKNTNVEPRIYSFIEDNGIRISAWYLTNAYATLTLRSVISTDILDAFLQEDDITIAYPTQKFYIDKEMPKENMASQEEIV